MAHDEHELSSDRDHRFSLDVHEDGELWLHYERLGSSDPREDRIDAICLEPQVAAMLLRLLPRYVPAIDQLAALSYDVPVLHALHRPLYPETP